MVRLSSLEFTDDACKILETTFNNPQFNTSGVSKLIYNQLMNEVLKVSFCDYLKRYIYHKAELRGSYTSIPDEEYKQIIINAFKENRTPASFNPQNTGRVSTVAKNWVTQKYTRRISVFLLGFGLKMSEDDVNEFLTKALREPAINPKDPFEALCSYCYKNGYDFVHFSNLYETYKKGLPITDTIIFESTESKRKQMSDCYSDDNIINFCLSLKENNSMSVISKTAKSIFDSLITECCKLISDSDAHIKSGSKGISLFDVEKYLYSQIPTDNNMNLLPINESSFGNIFRNKRLTRQRLSDILSSGSPVNSSDLITLNFLKYSFKDNSNSLQFEKFIKSTNEILSKCAMGQLNPTNPYESFILMCMMTPEPLKTYNEVWKIGYEI